MKVLLVNGGPHKTGCTYTALEEVASTLREAGVETEIVWLGVKPVAGREALGRVYRLRQLCGEESLLPR